jgi:predicted phosphodiesterase
MGRPITIKSELVAKYIKKFHTMSKSSLADLIMEKEPLIFDNKESVRALIRYHCGASGINSRTYKSGVSNTSKVQFIGQSQAKRSRDYSLPQKNDNILWLSDIHIPNHDEEAVNIALNYGLKKKVNTIIIGGDLLDNEPFSSWEKKPHVNQVKRWFDMAYDFLLTLRLRFPDADIFFLMGNHDLWYEKWLIRKAPILFDDHYYKLEHRLRFDELGIICLDEKTKLKIDDLYALHGHTLMRQKLPPVNAARGLFMRAKHSAIIGHVHSTSKHVESTIKGKMIACFSVGCLCTLSPDYDPHNTKHNQGFAHITRKSPYYHVDNLEIQDGVIYQKLIN